MTKMSRATVLLSGGIDSAACAYNLRAQGFDVEGLFVDYGQAAAAPEAKAVSRIATHLGIPVQRIGVSGLAPSGAGELVGRNAFLIFAALFAARGRPGLLGLGLHAGTRYYDSSESFIKSAGKLVAEHTDGQVALVAPFASWSKKDVYDYFLGSGLPIGFTRSCESGAEMSCGVCLSCHDRGALGC